MDLDGFEPVALPRSNLRGRRGWTGPRADPPNLTIQQNDAIFNKPIVGAFTTPRVRILYHPKRALLAFLPANQDDCGPDTLSISSTGVGQLHMSAGGLRRVCGLCTGRRYAAYLENGVVFVDVKEPMP